MMMTIEAVARGARSDRDIASAIGGLDARQGRYYRRAAEILGFITRDAGNHSIPTAAGREYANANQTVKRELFVRAVLGNGLFQRLLPFLEAKGASGASRGDMEAFLGQVADLGAASMVERRISSYMGWLVKLGLAKMAGSRLALDQLPAAVPLVSYESNEEPIFPNRYELKEYEEQAQRVASKREAITYYVDQAVRERAASGHQMLVNLMAERLRRRGAVPKANRYIDLSARWERSDYLFEMKSTTDENPHAQIRRGLSQLYEYRYIQSVQEAKLVLVIENPLPRKLGWIENYLTKDRGILLVWDGDRKFSCSPEIRKQLEFMSGETVSCLAGLVASQKARTHENKTIKARVGSCPGAERHSRFGGSFRGEDSCREARSKIASRSSPRSRRGWSL
ncbi:MAG: hypothetical protein KIS67_27285 [Verrucomicrobiae bacterium]|nr:hypothetical protein [Verrucomicrobiae bacterium]